MTKVMLTEKLYDIKNGEVYKAHIRKGCDFTIVIITENGETTSYYTADLIESAEEWEEGNFNLEVVGDDFQIIREDKQNDKVFGRSYNHGGNSYSSSTTKGTDMV